MDGKDQLSVYVLCGYSSSRCGTAARQIANSLCLVNRPFEAVNQRSEVRWNRAARYREWPQLNRWLMDQIGFEADGVKVVVQEFSSSAVASVAAGANTRSAAPPDA